ncbi:transporter [Longibacter salinarum]|uniref:Transporter n=1 Tax=Longibacter salinarum TaxID=1850348 RepID=A0A2A8CVP8_9BACT|nr:formate/nitrite transporter family protein [Longibacter salinarum]PEN12762.1 transporter [Longibacter salinarum]
MPSRSSDDHRDASNTSSAASASAGDGTSSSATRDSDPDGGRDAPDPAPDAGGVLEDRFSTDEIFRRLVAAADEEFARSNRLLFLSGLAAGLSISLSFLGIVALESRLSGAGAPLVSRLMYPVGFFFVVMGRYQLFTENTLSPVALVLTRRASLPLLFRVWGIVLLANVVGAAACALVFAWTGVFDAAMTETGLKYGEHFVKLPWDTVFWKAIFAGWLVAGMVWLNFAARSTTARFFITFILIYVVAAADLAHCIVGSTETLFAVFRGAVTWKAYLIDFLAPSVLGNTVGGVLLVAILNFAQTEGEMSTDALPHRRILTWRECIVGEDREERMES